MLEILTSQSFGTLTTPVKGSNRILPVDGTEQIVFRVPLAQVGMERWEGEGYFPAGLGFPNSSRQMLSAGGIPLLSTVQTEG